MGGSHSVVNPIGKNFLGTGGTPLNKPLSFVSPLNPGFLGGGTAGRVGRGFVTGGMSEYGEGHPFGTKINNPFAIYNPSSGGSESSAIPGPFTLDQGQFDADRAAISGEGDKQYQETLTGLGDVSKANTQRAKDLFGQMLPDIAENAQASHLYDSTGYGQEVGRQQANIASEVANQEAQARLAALSGKQAFGTGALQRGLSMEDFINQANVAKTIGAQMAPQQPSGKATGLSGGVAGAAAGAPFGPWGAGLGGLGGLALGSQACLISECNRLSQLRLLLMRHNEKRNLNSNLIIKIQNF